MTAQEIRKMTDEEILEKIKASKSELLDLRMQNARGALEKPVKIPSYTINKIKADMKRLIHWHKQELQIE